MKNLFLFLVAVGIAGGLYQYSQRTEARPPRLAADGVYFLRDYFSVTTPTGVCGWVPGQQLWEDKASSHASGVLVLTDGKCFAAVPSELLTRDLDEAYAIGVADQNGQAAVQHNAMVQAGIDAQKDTEARIAAANRIQSMNDQRAADSAVGGYISRLHQPAYSGYYAGYAGPTYVVVPTSSGATRPATTTSAAVVTAPSAPMSSTAGTSSERHSGSPLPPSRPVSSGSAGTPPSVSHVTLGGRQY